MPDSVDIENALGQIPPGRRAQARRDLAQFDRALAGNPNLIAARVGKAAVLRSYGLHAAAALEFRTIAKAWAGVDWPRLLVHEEDDLERKARAKADALAGSGKTYALAIGISKYSQLSEADQLRFADSDAKLLSEYLQTARGGGLPAEQVQVLTNERATVSAIRTGITTFLQARAGKKDTVILFLAAHGAVDERGAYILGSDSDIEDLKTTALPMLEIQRLIEGELGQVGRVVLYVDVCRAGAIGALRDNRLSRIVQILARMQSGETFGLMATSPGESSWESERFGGGHGAFSYFLIDGLNGGADQDADGEVDAGELSFYVTSKVREATRRKQNPRTVGDMPTSVVMVRDLVSPGIQLQGWKAIEEMIAQKRQGNRNRRFSTAVPSSTDPIPGTEDLIRFENALRAGRLLPPDPDNAADALARLKQRFGQNRLDYLNYENQLWIALLDRGQNVMLRYLRGDQVPQRAEDFERGQRFFQAALAIDPESLAVESRALFCQARALIFERRYAEAVQFLERAARVDPEGAYIYNALGIAYLEQGAFSIAAAAFRDAARLAPLWVYPKHNLALTLVESGSNSAAIAAYRAAIRTAPDYWYLPYNLGLLYQKRNERRQADAEFRAAIAVDDSRPEPYNALGLLQAGQKKRKDAERSYRLALQRSANYLPAKHNLGLMLSQDRRRRLEAISLWREVLRDDPSFLASRFSLAEVLEHMGNVAGAMAEYEAILRIRPDAVSARSALARLEGRQSNPK